MGSLLAVYDSGKLGLTDPSPGGGSVPVVYRAHRELPWRVVATDAVDDYYNAFRRGGPPDWRNALLLVTEDGTPDPVGMARAREVLARVVGLDVRAGVSLAVYMYRGDYSEAARWSDPEALARLLAEHAGVEVVRG